MSKKFMADLFRLAEKELENCQLRCLSMEMYAPKSLDGREVETTVRAEAEILRGQGLLSRNRIIVKLPYHSFTWDEEFFDNNDCLIKFKDLKLTFVDSRTGNGYFSASGYTLIYEESGEIFAKL